MKTHGTDLPLYLHMLTYTVDLICLKYLVMLIEGIRNKLSCEDRLTLCEMEIFEEALQTIFVIVRKDNPSGQRKNG